MSTVALAAALSEPTTVGYPVLFFGVLFGSVVPVVPTGAVVGAGAALAMTTDTLMLPVVVVFAVAGAVLGDMITFSVCRYGGPRALAWVARRQDPARIAAVREQFRLHGWQIIVAGRLLPAGRIPVLLAAGALDYPWRRMIPADIAAATLWALAYAALGVLSGGIFDSPLIATLLASLLVLLVGAVTNLVSARRRRRKVAHDPAGTNAASVAGTDEASVATEDPAPTTSGSEPA